MAPDHCSVIKHHYIFVSLFFSSVHIGQGQLAVDRVSFSRGSNIGNSTAEYLRSDRYFPH